MPPPKPVPVTKDELELRLVPITTATNDAADQIFGNERKGIKSLLSRVEQVEEVLDKYKFTLTALTIVANSIITLALAALQIYKALHGTP